MRTAVVSDLGLTAQHELSVDVRLQLAHGGHAEARDDVLAQHHRADERLRVLGQRQAKHTKKAPRRHNTHHLSSQPGGT